MDQEKVILYVDDDADDREFLSHAIKEVSPETRVVLAENGVKALSYLNETTGQKDKLPCLIVLDLNMPFLDGRETYERIRVNPELQQIPTIVFTSSLNPNDKALFNSFGIELISKPDNLGYLSKIATHMVAKCYC
jgi:CheY-like chemotaxis protein